MNVNVIRTNNDGVGTAGCTYDDGNNIATGLAHKGHVVKLLDPAKGFNESISSTERVAIATQPEKHNGLLQDFAARHPGIGWRPSWGNIHLLEDILDEGNIFVVHVCIEKAYRVTGSMSLSDSAREINAYRPDTLIVVTDPSGAAACHYDRVVKVLSHRIRNPNNTDGLGAAFFGAFLGELLNTRRLVESLEAGHRAAAVATQGIAIKAVQ